MESGFYNILKLDLADQRLACEEQTYFRSSLLSLGGREATTGNTSALRRLIRGVKQQCFGTANDEPGVEFTLCSIRSRGVDRCLSYLCLPTIQREIICSKFVASKT